MPSLTTDELFALITNDTAREELLNSWPRTRCALCKRAAATGIWFCQFSKNSPPYIRGELKTLCAGCGLTDCYKKWNGFMSPKLLRCDLFMTITCPEGDKRTAADKLIERILTAPNGAGFITAWKLMFKPSNVHHPIAPAMETLRAIYDRLFPSEPKPD